MQLSDGTILQIVMYLLTAVATVSTILHRIKELEKRVEKHNGVMERMIVVEKDIQTLVREVDKIVGNCDNCR